MRKKYSMDAVFALILYGMFTLISLLLVLIGALIYKRIVGQTDARSDVRASLSYVANKVRSSTDVQLETREGLTVLVLSEGGENPAAKTMIYAYDGKLRELFQWQEETFSPANGEELVAVSDFSVEQASFGLLTMTTTDANGHVHTLHIQDRAG